MKKYIIDKVGIRDDSVFYSGEDFQNDICEYNVYYSLDKAVAEAAMDVYNEIGWNMDDLVGKFEEVCGFLRSSVYDGRPYSFADIVWQIKEIDD